MSDLQLHTFKDGGIRADVEFADPEVVGVAISGHPDGTFAISIAGQPYDDLGPITRTSIFGDDEDEGPTPYITGHITRDELIALRDAIDLIAATASTTKEIA